MVSIKHFHDNKCNACKKMEPEMRKLKSTHKNWKIENVNVGTKAGEKKANKAMIRDIPTTIVQQGDRVIRFVGSTTKAEIEKKIYDRE